MRKLQHILKALHQLVEKSWNRFWISWFVLHYFLYLYSLAMYSPKLFYGLMFIPIHAHIVYFTRFIFRSIEYIHVQNTMIISFSVEWRACRWRPLRTIFCSKSFWEYHDPLCTLSSKFHPTLNGHDLKPAKYCRGIQSEHHWPTMAPNILMFDSGPLGSAHHCDWSVLDEHL